MFRRWRVPLALLAVVPASIAMYALCALCLGLVSVNTGYSPPAQGVTIYLRHNGIHTDLLLPAATPQIDWRREFRAADFAPPLQAAHPPFRLALAAEIPPDRNPVATFVAIGWGDRGFYFDTPTWADLTPPVAVMALSGVGDSVVHVEYLPTPAPGPRLRSLTLSPAAYARLVSHVQAAFARDAAGARIAYAGRGYTLHDTFYAARGHFSPLTTCNEWVRGALADAGVRVPMWAPLPYALFRQFE